MHRLLDDLIIHNHYMHEEARQVFMTMDKQINAVAFVSNKVLADLTREASEFGDSAEPKVHPVWVNFVCNT